MTKINELIFVIEDDGDISFELDMIESFSELIGFIRNHHVYKRMLLLINNHQSDRECIYSAIYRMLSYDCQGLNIHPWDVSITFLCIVLLDSHHGLPTEVSSAVCDSDITKWARLAVDSAKLKALLERKSA